MQVAKVTVNHEALLVRPDEVQTAIRAPAGDNVDACDGHMRQVEMSEVQFAAIPKCQ